MADDDIRNYSAAELREMRARGEYWSTAPDAPEIELGEDFWRNARLVAPRPAKQAISLRVDADVLAWFRAQGRGYQSRMNAVLRAYAESHRTPGDAAE